MSRKSLKHSPKNSEGVNLLNAFIGARKRNDESLTHAQRRLAADINYSDSAIKRAVRNGIVSDRLRAALIERLDDESKYTKRSIYFGLRLMSNAKGKRLSKMQEQALHESGKFRGRVKKYRNKVQGEFTKRLRKIERQNLLALGIEDIEDAIFDMSTTPSA